MNRRLDEVFENFGLIICGWSGAWDHGLREAMERCKSRRYSTYWADPIELKGRGQTLLRSREAQFLHIESSDKFFCDLRDKIQAMQAMTAPHPLTVPVAVATIKKLLVDKSAEIRLSDFVTEEARRLVDWMDSPETVKMTDSVTNTNVKEIVRQYDTRCEILLNLLATGCYWGDESKIDLWVKILNWIAESADRKGPGNDNIRIYPLLQLVYGTGVAAVANNKLSTLHGILVQAGHSDYSGKHIALCMNCHVSHSGVLHEFWPTITGKTDDAKTQGNQYLQSRLRDVFHANIPSENAYVKAFDRFEYYLGLVHSYFRKFEMESLSDNYTWGPWGCFSWRHRIWGSPAGQWLPDVVQDELTQQGERWPLLRTNFFDGSLEKGKVAVSNYNAFIKRINGTWF
jgi:hypothetical protein